MHEERRKGLVTIRSRWFDVANFALWQTINWLWKIIRFGSCEGQYSRILTSSLFFDYYPSKCSTNIQHHFSPQAVISTTLWENHYPKFMQGRGCSTCTLRMQDEVFFFFSRRHAVYCTAPQTCRPHMALRLATSLFRLHYYIARFLSSFHKIVGSKIGHMGFKLWWLKLLYDCLPNYVKCIF